MADDRFAVQHSVLTNTIYAGRPNKAGTMWLAKTDVTNQAIAAVAEHVLARYMSDDPTSSVAAMALRDEHGGGYDIAVTRVRVAASETPKETNHG